MAEKVFFGKGIRQIKKEYPQLYDSIENLDKNIWNANILDYRAQKLIAIAISATNHESSSFLKQVIKTLRLYSQLCLLKTTIVHLRLSSAS